MTSPGNDLTPDQAQALEFLASSIRQDGRGRYQYLREMFALLGDKWSVPILLVLSAGRMRHATVRRALDAMPPHDRISQRILTLKLRMLEQHGLVERTVSDDRPPKVVDYALTEMGRGLTVQVRRIIDWLNGGSAITGRGAPGAGIAGSPRRD